MFKSQVTAINFSLRQSSVTKYFYCGVKLIISIFFAACSRFLEMKAIRCLFKLYMIIETNL